jgi:hypothetical protein
MTTREQAIAFLRGLKAGDEGATIYQDVIDHVLAAFTEAERSERAALDSVDSLTRACAEFAIERACYRRALDDIREDAELLVSLARPFNLQDAALGIQVVADNALKAYAEPVQSFSDTPVPAVTHGHAHAEPRGPRAQRTIGRAVDVHTCALVEPGRRKGREP